MPFNIFFFFYFMSYMAIYHCWHTLQFDIEHTCNEDITYEKYHIDHIAYRRRFCHHDRRLMLDFFCCVSVFSRVEARTTSFGASCGLVVMFVSCEMPSSPRFFVLPKDPKGMLQPQHGEVFQPRALGQPPLIIPYGAYISALPQRGSDGR